MPVPTDQLQQKIPVLSTKGMAFIHLPILIFNQTVLWQGLQLVSTYLQGPTIVYHDGTGDVDTIVRSVAASHPVVVANTPHHPSSVHDHLPHSAIIVARDPYPFVRNLHSWPMWTARSRVLLVLDRNANIRAWLEALWRGARAANVVAMVVADAPEYYTWFPYQPGECSDVSTVTKLNESSLFPDKIGPFLNHCPLIAVTTPCPPLLGVDDFSGVEPRLFQDLARKVGMNATYHRLPEGETVWKTLEVEGTPANGLKLLWENDVDILFSGLGVRLHHLPFVEFLHSHTTDWTIYFVPGPRLLPRTAAIYRAFSPELWAGVLGTSAAIFLATIGLACLQGTKPYRAFLETVSISLNLSTNLPNSLAFKIFIIAAYIYSLHITTAYGASLIIFLSDAPREKAIRTTQDLLESNFKVEILEGYRPILYDNPVIKALSTADRVIWATFLNLDAVADPGNIAVLGLDISYNAILREPKFYDEFGFPRAHSIPGIEDTVDMSLHMSKGHPLYPVLNRYSRRLVEGGLAKHYGDELTRAPSPLYRKLVPFGLPNVEGAFFIYLTMIAACFVVWLAEVAFHVFTKHSNWKEWFSHHIAPEDLFVTGYRGQNDILAQPTR